MRHKKLASLSLLCLGACMAFWISSGVSTAQAEKRGLLAVRCTTPWTLREIQRHDLDLVSYDPDTATIYLTADAAEQQFLLREGYALSHVEIDAESRLRRLQKIPDLGLYHTFDEMVTELQQLALAHPELMRLEVIGQSLEGRDIYAVKVSDVPEVDDAGEPDVLIVGNHHARELMSVEVPLHFLRHLLNNYRRDPRVTDLVDQREIWFVPMLNPDGHVYQEQTRSIPGWRKNRRPNFDSTIGVDLNRNYSFMWGHDEVGSSSAPLSETYRGVSPFSEPETSALRQLVERQDFAISLSYHSFGELLLYPWGWTDASLSPDHEAFASLAEAMVADNGYRPGNAYLGTIYLTNGEFDDYMYGEVSSGKVSQTFAFTVELNTMAQGGFWPDETLIQPTCDKLLSMNLYTVEVADNVRANVPPPKPQLQAEQDAQHPWRIELSWSVHEDVDNPVHHYEVFEIDPNGSEALQRAAPAMAHRNGRTLLARDIRVPHSGRLYLAIEAELEPLWDFAYIDIRPREGTWQALEGDITRVTDPTGRNGGAGFTGVLFGRSHAFDASRWAGRAVDLSVRLDAAADSPRSASVVARLDVPRTYQETRRILDADVRGTSYSVIAERTGLFAYGVTSVDEQDQKTDSEVEFFHIPVVTSVEVSDIRLNLRGSRAFLHWTTHSDSEARFVVWQRRLSAHEQPEAAVREWQRDGYRRVADTTIRSTGASQLDWPSTPGRQAVLLFAEDEDGPRLWGPFIYVRSHTTGWRSAHPNPFNPSTRLSFELEQDSHVRLDVFDASGRRVRRLLSGDFAAGVHEAGWNGRDGMQRPQASGVYFARLWVEGRSFTQRLVLLR